MPIKRVRQLLQINVTWFKSELKRGSRNPIYILTPFFVLNYHKSALTSETDISTLLHLRSSQRHIKHLHTRDTTTETCPWTRSASHNGRIVSGESHSSSNVPLCNGRRLAPEGGQPGLIVVTGSDVVPTPWAKTSSSQDKGASARTSDKLHVQGVSSDNPQAHTGSLRLVVEYRSAAFRVDPCQKGDGVPGVDAAVIGEIDVATASTSEVEGSSRESVWSWSQMYLTRTSGFVLSWTNVTSLCSAVERVQSDGTWWSCNN